MLRRASNAAVRRKCTLSRLLMHWFLLIWINNLIGNWAYRIIPWSKITNCHQYN